MSMEVELPVTMGGYNNDVTLAHRPARRDPHVPSVAAWVLDGFVSEGVRGPSAHWATYRDATAIAERAFLFGIEWAQGGLVTA